MKSIMKRIIKIILMLMPGISTQAQNYSQDDLRKMLLAEDKDSTKVVLLEQLAFSMVFSKPDSALLYAREGYVLAQKINFEKGVADCLNLIGTTWLKRGNYPKALEYRFRTLKIYERLKSTADLILINSNIGNILAEIGNSTEARFYYFKALQLSRDNHLKEDLPMVLCNIGDMYEKINMLDSARIYSHQAYELADEQKLKAGRGVLLCNLGNIHMKMKEDEVALGYYRLSIPDLAGTNNDEGICEVTMGMAHLFQRSEKPDSALHYARLSFAAAKRSGFTKPLFIASGFLSDFFKQANKTDSAYFYLASGFAARDSMFSQEKNRQLQNLIFAEQMRQQELAEAALLAEQERKDNLQLTGIAAFIPAFFALILFLRKRKANKKAIEFLGLLGVLLLFEFISLLIHPSIEKLTHHTPVLMLLILVIVASLLVPLHHRTAHWVKKKLGTESLPALPAQETMVSDKTAI
jgi:tetratricopeptide (TPR) repeat protein